MDATKFMLGAAPDPAQLMPTEKQIRFAKTIAARGRLVLPWEAQQDRRALSRWIEANAEVLSQQQDDAGRATSRQVAFAEKIARRKRLAVPDECFQSRELMSRWIDSNR